MQMRGKKIAAGDYSASFTMETARKDLRLMLDAGDGKALPLLNALAARMDEAIARGAAELDMAALAKPGV
jgi:3-hydroxyisobutyrate dehydrogenase-like beta-hydroxyacid dehydrogenase